MTTTTSTKRKGNPTMTYYEAPPKRRRRFPLFWLAFTVVNVGLIAAMIVSANQTVSGRHCQGLPAKDCLAATQAGVGIGFVVFLVLLILIDIAALIGRLIVSSHRRHRDTERAREAERAAFTQQQYGGGVA